MLRRPCSWPGGSWGGRGRGRAAPGPPGWINPLSHTHICPRPPPPPLRPTATPPCRGLLTLQPAEVSCAAGEPSVRSHCVNQRLLIAGTLSDSGSQPRPAPSVWGLWRRSGAAKVGSHWPALTGHGCWLGTDPSSSAEEEEEVDIGLRHVNDLWHCLRGLDAATHIKIHTKHTNKQNVGESSNFLPLVKNVNWTNFNFMFGHGGGALSATFSPLFATCNWKWCFVGPSMCLEGRRKRWLQ